MQLMFALRDSLSPARVSDAGRRELNKTRTRLRLNSEAIRLFAEQGYDNTSVEDIADAAEVSVRTLFRYFAGKDEILAARDYDLTDFLDRLAAQPDAAPPLTAIRNAYTEQRGLRPEEVEAALQFHRAVTRNPVLVGTFVDLQHRFRAQLAQALARRGGRHLPSDADNVVAAVAQTLLDIAFTQWAERDGRGNLSDIVKTIFQTFDNVTAPGATSTRTA